MLNKQNIDYTIYVKQGQYRMDDICETNTV